MVRFSDMLGTGGEADDADAADSVYAELANDVDTDDADEEYDTDDDADAPKEPVPVATFESPEAVLRRLTRYATAARAAGREPPIPLSPRGSVADPAARPEREDEPDPGSGALRPVGDDFLPTVRGIVRRTPRARRRDA